MLWKGVNPQLGIWRRDALPLEVTAVTQQLEHGSSAQVG